MGIFVHEKTLKNVDCVDILKIILIQNKFLKGGIKYAENNTANL